MSFSAPDLAGRPFENLRPVFRASVLMWVLGGLVLAFNLWLYSTHFAALSEHHDRQQVLDAEVKLAAKAVAGVESELGSLNLDWQNRQVVLLNGLIDQRTFSWSNLIDDLAEVLPRNVRLARLAPRISEARETRRGRSDVEAVERRVTLAFSGSADDGDALLEFLDGLFAHPRFEDPVLSGESRGENGEISAFGMTVAYLPNETPAPEVEEAAEAPTGKEAAEAATGEPAAEAAEAAADSPEVAP